MRWEDERYVRLYTRDTPELVALSWEARALMWELLRKVDRAGLLPVGKSGVRGLAGLLRMPPDVVERGLTELIDDGCVAWNADGVFLPNFLAAQEANQSDRARKAAQREKAAAAARDVTTRDRSSHGVTSGHESGQNVTGGHGASHAVTDGHSVPSLAVPGLAEVPASDGSAASPPPKAPPKSKRQDVTPEEQAARGDVLGAYTKGYTGARGVKPTIGGKEAAMALRLVRQLGRDEAIATIEAAFADPFYRTKVTLQDIVGNPDRYRGLGGQLPFSATPPGTHHAQRGLTPEQVFGEAANGPDPWDVPEAS